jgi:hypothetical protein
MGYEMSYKDSRGHFRRIATVTPSYAGISYDRIERRASTGPAPPGASRHPHLHGAAVHPRQGAVPRHRLDPAGGIGRRRIPAVPDHRPGAVPVPHRHHDHEDRRPQRAGAGILRGDRPGDAQGMDIDLFPLLHGVAAGRRSHNRGGSIKWHWLGTYACRKHPQPSWNSKCCIFLVYPLRSSWGRPSKSRFWGVMADGMVRVNTL